MRENNNRNHTNRDQKRKNKLRYLIVVLVAAVALTVAEYITTMNEDDKAASEVSNAFDSAYESAQIIEEADKNDGIAVHYIDVGQGDCSLIVCGEYTVLIDAGERGNEDNVIEYLYSYGIDELDYVVATHPHSDHVGSLDEVIETFRVKNVIMPRLTEVNTPSNSIYSDLLKAVKASKAKVIAAKAGNEYVLGNAVMTVLGPVYQSDNLNNMSVVVRIDYGESSFLFQGDAEIDEENDILETGADIDCDVLKVGHHGSYTSSSANYLKKVTPEIAVISCGVDNDYDHPHDKPLKRIRKHTEEIYRTDLCSDIVIISDGETYEIDYANREMD